MLHVHVHVPQVNQVVRVVLPELLHEESTPNLELLEEGGLLELINIALFGLYVEGIHYLVVPAYIFYLLIKEPPYAGAFEHRFLLLLLSASSDQEKVPESA